MKTAILRNLEERDKSWKYSSYSKAGFNILALAVSPQAQGQGIGKSLLQGLDQEAKRRGYGFIDRKSVV